MNLRLQTFGKCTTIIAELPNNGQRMVHILMYRTKSGRFDKYGIQKNEQDTLSWGHQPKYSIAVFLDIMAVVHRCWPCSKVTDCPQTFSDKGVCFDPWNDNSWGLLHWYCIMYYWLNKIEIVFFKMFYPMWNSVWYSFWESLKTSKQEFLFGVWRHGYKAFSS